VLFCPGGQAEMVHAWKAFLAGDRRELVLHTRHRGFCRCACWCAGVMVQLANVSGPIHSFPAVLPVVCITTDETW
jgi:hypothetical protein